MKMMKTIDSDNNMGKWVMSMSHSGDVEVESETLAVGSVYDDIKQNKQSHVVSTYAA